MGSPLFEKVVVDVERRDSIGQAPEPSISYIIHFTPRSGSSWLSDIVGKTQLLSEPGEYFNPNFIPNIAQSLGAADIDTYVRLIKRRIAKNGVFGAEITAHQIRRVFGGFDAFHAHFHDAKCFWLIRRDIVAQAVSLAKMVSTKVAHTAHHDQQAVAAADDSFGYDADVLKRWLKHIHLAEFLCESWFAEFEIEPLRMSYEDITSVGAHEVVNLISNHIGIGDIPPVELQSGHAKMGTQKNEAFAERFRKEEAEFLKPIDDERAEMLAKIVLRSLLGPSH